MRPFLFVLTIWLWSSAAFEGTWPGSDPSVFEPSPVVLASGGTPFPPPPPPPNP